jgi:GST-like protein
MAIDLYTWDTPNGHKVQILLEELGLDYSLHAVDIYAGDQFEPTFLEISPNNKIPALVDSEGPDGEPLALFESGAIMLYLAEKHGRFLPSDPRRRYVTLQWLMWQMGAIGPLLGQTHHFRLYAPEEVPYAIERYTNEARRLYHVLDKRLGEAPYLAGADYTIADIAVWPWVRRPHRQGVERERYPNYVRWFEEIAARPAVQRGVEALAVERKAELDDKTRDILFGATQYAEH